MEKTKGEDFSEDILTRYSAYNKIWHGLCGEQTHKRSPEASGQYTEELIRTRLSKYIPLPQRKRIKLLSGMIYNKSKHSPQIDIIICEPSSEDSILKVTGLVDVKRVYGIIEVKTLSLSQSALERAKEQIKEGRAAIDRGDLPAAILCVYDCVVNEEATAQKVKECEKEGILLGVIGKRVGRGSKEGSKRIHRYNKGEMPDNFLEWSMDFNDSVTHFLAWFDKVVGKSK